MVTYLISPFFFLNRKDFAFLQIYSCGVKKIINYEIDEGLNI